MTNEWVFVYTLTDPSTQQIRYVGVTVDLSRRLENHLFQKEKTHKYNWICGLRKRGLRPVIEELERIPAANLQEWQEAERFWIAYLRSLGFKLMNHSAGGFSGCAGLKRSEETKAKLSAIAKARGMPRATIEAANAACRGKPLSEAHRAQLRGKKDWSPEKRAEWASMLRRVWQRRKEDPVKMAELRKKLSVALKGNRNCAGRVLSDESRRKMSQSQKGRTVSAYQRQRVSEANKRRIPSQQQRDRARAALLGRPPHPNQYSFAGRKHSPESRLKMSLAMRGRPKTAEHREKIRQVVKAQKRGPDGNYIGAGATA